jgi:hypothetical protein
MIAEESKTAIVLGMHRSGTSVVAGILSILGVNMGKYPKKGERFNPKGNFEDRNLHSLNKKILVENDSTWDNPPKKELMISNRLQSEVGNLISSKRGIWGWKDPRTVFTLNAYLPYIKRPHFIFVYRNPLEIARSLRERESFFITDCLILVNKYNHRIVEIVKNNKKASKLFISYEDILVDPLGESDRISKFLELKPTDAQMAKIRKFVMKPDKIYRKRNRVKPDHLSSPESLREELQSIYSSRSWKVVSFLEKIYSKILLRNKW